MSTEIDQRVVQMRFDNKQFEANVKTTMSSLDKLKQKLHLDGAAKGIENVNAAAKKTDMTHLGKGLETVQAKFSALEVIGVTALANITNSAVNAGKKIVSALTIDPIKSGFQEYETQMNAVQTILANTESKGSTLDDVNRALDELNTYADKTIYNFTEMTRNIGTFTAAGVDLETSVNSIKGIANLAAVSGSTSQQASTAMYQLSQALAAGKVSLMDWNSVVNAGMGGELFQNALIRTSELLHTGAKDAIATYGSFRESLTKGQWLTTDVLTETLKQLAGSYTEAELIAQGFTKEQAKEITRLANTASDAATKVKTFSQLWDVMKESAQSGWAQTWKLIIGDFEQAKALLTPLADFFTGAINKMSEARNNLLKGALGERFSELSKKLNTLLGPAKAAVKTVEGAKTAVQDLGNIVDRVIIGEFGNGKRRFDALTEAGYNYYAVQNKVNEKLGDSFRYSEELAGAQNDLTKAQNNSTDAQKEATEVDAKRLEQLAKMSDAELTNLGYTKEQIKSLRELKREADKLGLSVSDFVEGMDELSGRMILMNSFKNIGKSLVTIFSSIGKAYREIFPPMTSQQLYDIIAAFHKFSTKLVISDKNADKLKRTFKGLFAALDIVLTIVGGPIKIAFKILGQLLGAFDLNLLDVTALIGDAIVKFRDWIDSVLDFTKVFEKIAPAIQNGIKAIRNWFSELNIMEKIPTDIIMGFVKGLGSGLKAVGEACLNFGKKIIETVKDILGIHSPSTVFFDIAKNIIEGLINGIKWGISQVTGVFGHLVSSIGDVFGKVDWGTIIAIGGAIGALMVFKKIGDALDALTGPLQSFERIGDGVANVLNGTASALKGFSQNLKAKALMEIAKAVALLVGAVVVMTLIEPGKLWASIGALAAIATVLGVLTVVIGKATSGKTIDVAKFSGLILALSSSLLLIAWAIKIVSGLDPSGATRGVTAIAGMIAVISLFIYITKYSGGVVKAGGTILALSVALLLLTGVMAILGNMEQSTVEQGLLVLGTLITFIGLFCWAMSSFKKDILKAGGTILALSFGLLLLTGVIGILGNMEGATLQKGIVILGLLMTFIGVFVWALTKNKRKIIEAGGTILALSAALLLLTGAIAILGNLDTDTLIKGGIVVAALTALLGGLVICVSRYGKKMPKVAAMLLSLSATLLVLAAVIAIFGLMDKDVLIQGGIAVSIFITLIGGFLVAVSQWGKNVDKARKTLLMLSIAIGVMAAAVIALSFVDPSKLTGATTALAVIMGMFALIVKQAAGVKKGMGVLIVLTVALGVMTAALMLLSELPAKSVLSSAVALSSVMLALAGAIKIISKVSKTVNKANRTILVLAVSVAAIGGVLYLLSKADPAGTIGAAIALGIVLTALATAVKIIGKVSKTITQANSTILVLSVAVSMLGGVIYLLAKLPVTNVIGSAIALSTLMIALSVAVSIIAGINVNIQNALMGVLALLALSIPLVAFIGVLALMQNIQNAMMNATILAALATTMTLLLIPLTLVGAFGPTALIGVLALLTLAVPLVAFVGILALMEGLENAMTNANVIISLLGALQELMIVLAVCGPLALIGVGAVVALIGLITIVGALAVAIGALLEFCPAIEDFLSSGLRLLIKLAGGIGEMISAFLGGIIETLAPRLPELGNKLSEFMSNAQGFINGAKTVNSAVLKGVSILAGAVLELTIADFINSVSSFLTMGSNFADLGNDLSKFVSNAQGFIEGTKNMDESSMKGVKALASAVLTLTASKILDGLTKWLTGGASLSKFGKDLEAFGPSMAKYSDAVKDIDVDAVKVSSEAGKTLAEMAKTMPKEGGLLSKIFGKKDAGTFGKQIKAFGEGMKSYSDSVKGINIENVKASTEAGKALSKMAKEMPNSGGLLGTIMGENDADTFGKKMKSFGGSLKSYSDSVKGLDVEAVKASTQAGKSLASMAKKMPNSGGLLGAIMGENDADTFGKQLSSFGASLKTYGDAVIGIDVESIKASVNAATSLTKMGESSDGLQGVVGTIVALEMESFAVKLALFGTGLTTYSLAVAGINPTGIANSVLAATALSDMFVTAPYIGQMISFFSAEHDYETFGLQLVSFGRAMQYYSMMVAAVDPIAVANSTMAVSALANMFVEPEKLYMLASFFSNSDHDFATFGTQLMSFGASLTAYSTSVAGIDSKAIINSVIAARALVSLTEAIQNGYGSICIFMDKDTSLSDFGSELVPFGASMKSFSDKVAGIDAGAMKNAVTGAKQIASLIRNLEGIQTNGVKPFVNAVKTLGTTSVNAFINAFTSSTSRLSNIGGKMVSSVANGIQTKQSMLSSAGGKLVDKIVSGIKARQTILTGTISGVVSVMCKAFDTQYVRISSVGEKCISHLAKGLSSKKQTVYKNLTSMMSQAVKKVKDYRDDFKNLGKYAVEGFAEGINKNAYKAKLEARAMAKAAYDAAKEAIDSNSPSKKFEELGKFSDQGLAIGLSRYAYLATNASASLGEGIVTSLKDTLGINSPSKVVKNEVGRYIVEGLAEGIKSDMSAEEQAEKKAQNIVSAFRKELDKADLAMTTIDLEHELFETKNPNLTDTENALLDIEVIAKKRAKQAENVKIAEDEYLFTLENLSDNPEAIEKAKHKWLEEQIKLGKLDNELKDAYKIIEDEQIEAKEDLIKIKEDRMDIYDLEQDIWEAENKDASETDKALQNIATLKKRKTEQQEIVDQREQEYLAVLNDKTSTQEQIQKAYKTYLDAKLEVYNIESDIDEEQAKIDAERLKGKEDQIKARKDRMEIYDLEQEVWEAENKNASDADKALHNISTLEKRKAEQQEIVHQREQEYLAVLNDRTSTQEQIKEAYKNLLNAKLDVYNTDSQIENENQTQLDKYAKAKQTYDAWLKENKRRLLDEGFTLDQIKAQAETQAWLTTGIMVNSFDPKKFEKPANAAETVGASLATSLGTGIQDNATAVSDSVASMGDACEMAIGDTQTDWHSSGVSLAQSFADGIRSNISMVVDAVVDMVTSALTAMNNTIASIASGERTIDPTISPVLDVSNVQNGSFNPSGLFMNSRSMAMAGIINDTSPQYSLQLDGVIDAINANQSENSMIKQGISDLNNQVNMLRNEINNMQVVLDSGAVAGAIAPKMDKALGVIANHKGRGN